MSDDVVNALTVAKALSVNPERRGARAMGFSGPWYHGTERLDRLVGKGKIDPKRATSGPMPYFTDDPVVASTYAKGKPDTSLRARDVENVGDYFTVHPKDLGISGRTPITVERSWHFLSPEKRQEIAEKALRVGKKDFETGEGELTLHPPGVNASNAPVETYNHMLREARGNHLAALRDLWHDSGNLIDYDKTGAGAPDLATVYKLAGYDKPISQENAPWSEARGVLPAMLRMRNPLNTSDHADLLKRVVPHLENAFKRDRSRKQAYGVDAWDKSVHYTPKEWAQELKADAAAGKNSFVWTSIPDKVTEQLRRLGHDGIIDNGGKLGGPGHTVAIPFEPNQVRSVFAKFDPEKLDSPDLMKNAGGSVRKARTDGGGVETPETPSVPSPKFHVGPIHSGVSGRTDHLPITVESGSYVLPADIVSAGGEGNTLAGFRVLRRTFGGEPYGVKGPYGQTKGVYGLPVTYAYGGRANENNDIWWHGSPSGDLRGGTTGLHLGTKEAATDALRARIGWPAQGTWDGTREYGKTLLAGKKTLNKMGPYLISGHNVDAPDDDYFAHQHPKNPTFSNGDHLSPIATPSLRPFKIVGPMTNTPRSAHADSKANGYMQAAIKKGNAKSGYYYKNAGEDPGSISAVVPNGRHLQPLPDAPEPVAYATGGKVRASGIMFLSPEKQVLLMRRAGENHKGEWAFPAGHIEKGETPERAARRETQEEAGYEHDGGLSPFMHTDSHGVDFVTYLAHSPRFAPKLNEEHDGAMWVDPAEAHKLPLHPGVKRALEKLSDRVGKAHGGGSSGVPIVAAGGEHVLSPEQVRRVGGGDLDVGHRVLDGFVKAVRKELIGTLSKLPGPRRD